MHALSFARGKQPDAVQRRNEVYFLPMRFDDLESYPESETVIIPVTEERLHVDTQPYERSVTVEKKVTSRDQWVEIPTSREEIAIERVAVNREVEAPIEAYYEGDTLVIPLLEEEVVTRKRLVLREEIRITKRSVQGSTSEKVTLRSEEVVIERNDEQAPLGNEQSAHI